LWPVVNKSFSLVTIGPKLSHSNLNGRQGGFLIPLVNQILTGEKYSKPGDSPLAIIICPFWQTVQDLASLCNELGTGIPVGNDGQEFTVGSVYNNEQNYAVHLTNGCHLLVTTPRSLVRMLDPSKNLTSLERCGHLIFEQAEICFEEFPNEVQNITKKYLVHRGLKPNETNQVSKAWWSTQK
jgi:superfamily II DNA/RNA helicase